MAQAAQYRTEHVAQAPRGWRVRMKAPGPRSSHLIAVAFPPGRRKKGSGKLVEILHPKDEAKNPTCEVSKKAKSNPTELLIFGNPSSRDAQKAARERAEKIRGSAGTGPKEKPLGHKAGCKCFACKHARGENPKRKPSSKRGKYAVRRRAAHRHPAASRRRRPNSSETEQAVRLFETFHGKDASSIAEKHVSAAIRKDYTALGHLEKLIVRTPLGQDATFDFEGDGVMLASSPDGKQLYCIGGRQNLLSCLDEDSQQKDFIDLGECLQVEYLARKVHSNYEPTTWYHKFGEKTGARPQLMFDKLKKQIFFVGGEYFIDPKVDLSPGIEN